MKKVVKIGKRMLLIYLVLCLGSTVVVNAKNGFFSSEEFNLKHEQNSWKQKAKNKLIKKGFCSSDINSVDDEYLKQVADSEEVSVDIKYYKLDENENRSEITDKKEIQNILKMYDPESLEQKKEFEVSLNPLDILGEKEVLASDISLITSYDKYLRVSLLSTATTKKYNGQKVYSVYASSRWLKSPTNRKKDVVSVHIDNTMGIISQNNNFPITTSYTNEFSEFVYYYDAYGKQHVKIDKKYTKSGKLSDVNWKNYCITGIWSLPDNFGYQGGYTAVTNMIASIQFYTYRKSDSVKVFEAWTEYYHQEAKIEFKPTIKFGESGVGFTFTSNHNKYMKEETPSAKIDQVIK